MVQIIEQSLPYGKLAENFGRSLGESMGEETHRKLGVQNLSALADQFLESGTTDALKIFTTVMNEPGMTPQLASALVPMYQSGIRSKTAENLRDSQQPEYQPLGAIPTAPSTGQPQATPQERPQQAIPVGRQGIPGVQPTQTQAPFQQDDKISLQAPGEDPRLQTPYYPDPQQIAVGGAELRRQNPGLHANQEAGESAYSDLVTANNNKLLADQNVAKFADEQTEAIKSETEKRIAGILQSSDSATKWNDLSGLIQNNLLNEAVNRVTTGQSKDKESAADYVGKKALNVAKSIAGLKDQANRPFIGRGDENSIKRLSGYQKTFEDVGALDDFRSTLMSMGYGPHVSSTISYPTSVELRKVLARNPKKPPAGTFMGYSEGDDAINKYIQKVANAISPTDSIETVGLILSDYGIDEKLLYDEMNKRIEDKLFTANQDQQRELQARLPVSPTFEDIYTYSMPGYGTGPFGLLETINRYFTGKR